MRRFESLSTHGMMAAVDLVGLITMEVDIFEDNSKSFYSSSIFNLDLIYVMYSIYNV